MTPEGAAVLGIAATLAVAAISAFGWLIKLTLSLQDQNTRYRHDLRNEVNAWLNRAEEALTRRIERLEAHSHGWREWRAGQGERHNDD